MARIESWDRISPLLDELLDADAQRRTVRLAEIRRDDAPLADAVARLLALQPEIERAAFLEGDAFGANRIDGVELASLAGQSVGNYALERPLGQGGMGSVWLARRSDGRFEGKAAVKFVNLALLGSGGAERFRREGNILARLAHTNIARLIDAGVASGGQPYLVLEYVEGEPIDRWCDAHALGVRARIELFLAVLDAVAHAHSNLILHRDLKPSNVLVDKTGRVKLLDFGVAKLIDDRERPAAATELTQLAGRAFTPEFAAPEQIQGGDVTTATDVYALGVVLFALLAGRHPTEASSGAAVDRMRAVLEREPARLSDAAQRTPPDAASARTSTPPRLARELRGDLDNIVAKALKKTPSERYPTAVAFADDLRRYLNHEPVSARADSIAYRAGKFIRRHRAGVVAVVAICLALIAGLAGTVWQAREAALQRDRALVQLQRAESAAEFVNLMIFSVWGADERLSLRDFLTRSEALASRQLSGQAERQAVVLHTLGSYYASLGDHRQAERLHLNAKSLLSPTTDVSLRASIECSHSLATAMLGSVDAGKESIARWVARVDVEPQVAVQCEMYLAHIAQTYNDPQGALKHAQSAEKRLAATPHALPTLKASLHGDLGYGFAMNDRIEEADLHYDTAIRMYRELGQGETPAVAAILNNWALVSLRAGDYRHALRQIDEVIRIAMGRGAGGVPPYAVYNRAVALLGLGRYEEAVAEADRAIQLGEQAANLNVRFRALAVKAGAHAERGDVASAEASYREAEAISGKLPAAARDPHLLLLRRAQIELAWGRPDEARVAIEGVIDAFPDPRRAGAPLANALRVRAEALARLGARQPALADVQAALAIAQRLQSGRSHSLRAGQLWLLSARIKRDTGDAAGSRTDAAQALEHLSAMLDDDHPDRRLARTLASS